MLKLLALSLFLVLSSPAISSETDDLATEARGLAKAFGGQLKQQLQAGMKGGGPLVAMDICNAQAPAIATAVGGSTGWKVGRSSLKARSENNRPDEWEMLAMLDFEKQKSTGQNMAAMENYAVIENSNGRIFRYMKAIPTAEVCLACHGENVKSEVLAKINQLYPMDQALGFKAGDIRGAFTLSKKLD